MFSSIWHASHGTCSWACRSRRRESRGGGRARQGTRYRPSIERLEDRTVPTTVTTQLELITAIKAANTAGGTHTITLGADITLLETTPNNQHDGPNGVPEITNHDILTIAGDGHTLQRSTSTKDAAFRLFDIGSGATLSLQNMTVKNGVVPGRTATIIMGGGILQGGAIFVDNGGKLNLNQVDVTENGVTCTGVPAGVLQGGFIELQGGGIYNAGTTIIESSSVAGNSATYNLTTRPGQGDNLGSKDANNNDGNSTGDGFIGNVIVEGGGICNAGGLTIASSTLSMNRATSTVSNGSGNGDSDGNNNTGTNDGNEDGNGVIGNITVEGGGIYNASTTTLMGGSLTGNSASSNITNGSVNGIFTSDSDSNQSDGNDDGNGVVGKIIVAGGGIYNLTTLSATGTGLSGNFAASTVVNGNDNGHSNGFQTGDGGGDGNGNGVVGNILVAGGAVANDTFGTAKLDQCNVSGNRVTNSISDGNDDGQGDGDDNVGTKAGEDNGDGVAGTVDIGGGGIDNEGGIFGDIDILFEGSVTITSGSVSHNSVTSVVTNGNDNGVECGNNNSSSFAPADDGNGNGIASDLFVQGGGIRNEGDMNISSATVSDNSAASSITNGTVPVSTGQDDNGNDCGNNNTGSDHGDANGNGLAESLLVGGGAISDSGTLSVTKCTLTSNSLKSTISNGNDVGDGDGQSDAGNDDCGIGCGIGVSGVEVAGGAIVSDGSATVTSCSITGNSASSSVTNGIDNGGFDGSGSTGTDGQGDGNGANFLVEVTGGGTAKIEGGQLTLDSTVPTGNHVSSSPTSGSGNVASDGVVVAGTVTASGQNTFAPVAHENLGKALEPQTGYQVASISLPPSGSAPSIILDSRQPSLPIQGNQRTLMELPASVYEPAGTSAHTAIPAPRRLSRPADVDAFFLDVWDEGPSLAR